MTDANRIPDFSGDDFANDKEVQKMRAEARAYDQMIHRCLSLIQKELHLEDSSDVSLNGFYMFKNLAASITHSMKSVSQHNELRVSIVEYSSSFPTARAVNAGTDHYLFGHMRIRNSYPSTYIHKETIREKIEDVFLKRDVDFENSKKFSRKFQVLTEDKERLKTLLQLKNLDVFIDFPAMELEFSGSTCLFRSSRKPVSLEEANVFCALAKQLIELFG